MSGYHKRDVEPFPVHTLKWVKMLHSYIRLKKHLYRVKGVFFN
jgi:hypothetical protein